MIVTNAETLVAGGRNGVVQIVCVGAALEQAFDKRAEVFDGFRADDEIDMRKAVLEILLRALRRATGDDDFSPGLLRLPFLQPADFRERAIFRMLADGAGVDEQHRGIVGIFGLSDAARLQMASHLVGIRDIHLAPVGAHVILHKPEHYTCRMHEVPIEDSIDLHTFQPREIAMVVEEYLYQAVAKGFREVRIIHGRGIGVQREIVRAILARHPERAVVPRRPGPRIDDGVLAG